MTIEILGVNEYFGATATKSEISAGAGYISSGEIDVLKVNLMYANGSDVVKFANNQSVNFSKGGLVGSIVTAPQSYPGNSKRVSELFPEILALEKKFVYLYSSEYLVELKGLSDSSEALSIVVTDSAPTLSNEGFYKQITYNFEVDKGYVI